MSESDRVPDIDVSVAIIRNEEGKLLWIWNDRWKAFALPMTKRRGVEGRIEDASYAAARAAAEVLRVPVQVVKQDDAEMTLDVSGADGVTKFYSYRVYTVRAHPDLQHEVSVVEPHVWLTAEAALKEDLQPLTESSREIIRGISSTDT